MENLENKFNTVRLEDTEKNEDNGRSTSPVSDASDESFHSAGDEEEIVMENISSEGNGADEAFPPFMDASQNVSKGENIDVAEKFSEQSKSEKSDGSIERESQNNNDDDDDDEDEDDLIEENLKDLELSLTEEEKNDKKEEALKFKEEGNKNFKESNFSLALHSYTEGLRICPLSFPRDRSILYSNRAATKAKLDHKKDAIKDCDKAIDLHSAYTKAILRRATLYQETEKLDEALKDFQRVLELDPNNNEARYAVRSLDTTLQFNDRKIDLDENPNRQLRHIRDIKLTSCS
ncbi:unnamed protein product, partial [Meganyctiphanes norvegica]